MLRVCDPKSAPNGCSPFWAFVAPALFILLWSGGFTALKAGLADAEPITYLALRYGVVLAVLTPLFLVLRPPLPRSPDSEMRRQIASPSISRQALRAPK